MCDGDRNLPRLRRSSTTGRSPRSAGLLLSTNVIYVLFTDFISFSFSLFHPPSLLSPPPKSLMTVPRGNRPKRPRGSFSKSQHKDKLCQLPYPSIEERYPSLIAQTLTQRPSIATCQSQSRPVPHCRRKRRRFTANCTSVLQGQLPFASSKAESVFPTPSTSSDPSSPAHPSPPPSSPQPDEEERLSVTSERLRLKIMSNSSSTAHGNHLTGQVCTYEDWQDIKELFAKAAEQYNGKRPSRTFSDSTTPMPSPGSLSMSHTNPFHSQKKKPQKWTPSR